jgi:predicted dehydrogenase
MVGYQRHLGPAFIEARERIDGFDGPPKFITAEITQNWIEAQRGKWRTDPDLSGGGQLYDTGSHLIDAVLWTTGLTPEAVSAEMVFDDEAERVDTQAMVNVEFEEGTVASISVSGDSPQVREHIHVSGDEDTVYVTGEEWDDREVSIIDEDGGEYYPPAEGERTTKAEAFLEAIDTGSEPPATARDALAVTAVTEAAYESARTGERVEVDL